MTTRTFQFFGQGFGPDPVNITATFDGNVVYQGVIPTVPTIPDWTVPGVLLYTAEGIALDFVGTKPVTITVENGSAIVENILSNYTQIQNPVYSDAEFTLVTTPDKTEAEKTASIEIFTALAVPALTTEEIAIMQDPATPTDQFNAILDTHNLTYSVSTGADGFSENFYIGDSRINVTINGVSQSAPVPRPGSLDGDWDWNVGPGGVITYDLVIDSVGLN